MKKRFKAIAVLFGLLLIISGGFFIYAVNGLDRDIPLERKSAAALEDGRYQGAYEGGRWSNEVEVVVQDGEITDVIIIDDMLFTTASFSQEIIEKVLEDQQTDTDIVTGSTITSRAYLKAIEDALTP